MQFGFNLPALHLSERLGMHNPVIGFSIKPVWALEIEAFIEALEDAAVPEVGIGLCAHALLLLFLSLPLLQLFLELFKQFCWNYKQAILLERL
jgi:hypothetical protein